MSVRRTAAIGCGLLLVGALACKAREDGFYAKIFSCEPGGPSDQCGADRQGRPMMCYPGHLLGGHDFCATRCDPATPPADSRLTCIGAGETLQTGALLQRCGPTAGRAEPASSCPDGLACYRTDLQADEGICLMMSVCNETTDCPGAPPGLQCGGELLRGLLAGASTLMTDSLQCVPTGCWTQKSDCPLDHACLLENFASQGGMLPDICVPKCDPGHRCPPNFACSYDEAVAPGGPQICVPGIPGTRCRADQDCLVGLCTDTGAGFSVCTPPKSCRPDDYCALLNGPVDVFVCAEGIPGQFRCVNTRPFGGATCKSTDECPTGSGQECFFYSPDADTPQRGSCRLPCPADRRCPTRGGIPFFCIGETGEGGCYPGQFGLPCIDDTECPGNLTCEMVGPDARSRTNYSPNACTTPCTADADCDANPLTFHGGFCDVPLGFCRLAGQSGAPCTQASHCRSKQCGAPGNTCL